MFFSNKPETTKEMFARITKGKTTAREYGQALAQNGFIALGNQIIDDANWDTTTQN